MVIASVDRHQVVADIRAAKEIENLRNESQVLRRIRNSMGSPEFAKAVFKKVFKDDVDRLRSMEDMWKNRKAPSSLDLDYISQEASTLPPSTSRQDQRTWSLAENFVVFADRYGALLPFFCFGKLTLRSLQRLSMRSKQSRAESNSKETSTVVIFDKDDEDTLDFVAAAANLRSMVFGIDAKSKFDIKRGRS